MTTWHGPDDLPHWAVSEVEILFWDGSYVCRTFGAYDHDEDAWYVGGEPLIDDDTPEWEVLGWAVPRLMPAEIHSLQKKRQVEKEGEEP